MTITSCNEIHRGRGGIEEKNGLKSHTRIFQIITDNAYDDGNYILEFAGLPKVGDTYSTLLGGGLGTGSVDNRSYCVRRRVDQQDDRHNWYAFCDYEPRDNELRPKISVRWEKKKKVITGVRGQTVDANGQVTTLDLAGNKKVFTTLFANSYGDAFDPAPEGDVSYPVVIIKRVEPGGLSFPKLMYYRDAINSVNWGPVPEFCAKILGMNAEEEYRTVNSIEKKIWWVTYEIGLDPDTWLIPKLDAGFHFAYETGNAEGKPAGDRTGVFTDENGPKQGLLKTQIAVAAIGPAAAVPEIKGIRNTDLTNPNYIWTHFYPERDLAGLGLPTDLNAILPPATI